MTKLNGRLPDAELEVMQALWSCTIPATSREIEAALPAGRPIYVNCQSGLRSYLACRMLTGEGYECYNLSGGYGFYAMVMQDQGLPPEGTGPCGLK